MTVKSTAKTPAAFRFAVVDELTARAQRFAYAAKTAKTPRTRREAEAIARELRDAATFFAKVEFTGLTAPDHSAN